MGYWVATIAPELDNRQIQGIATTILQQFNPRLRNPVHLTIRGLQTIVLPNPCFATDLFDYTNHMAISDRGIKIALTMHDYPRANPRNHLHRNRLNYLLNLYWDFATAGFAQQTRAAEQPRIKEYFIASGAVLTPSYSTIPLGLRHRIIDFSGECFSD
jgi:hypothetical protein